jgi:2-haloacid dehalogenase
MHDAFAALPAEPPRAVLFDAYGTLFDVHSVSAAADELFSGQGENLSALWRDKQLEYSRLASMSGRYRPFSELTRAGLRHAALRLGLALDAAGEERLLAAYDRLSAYPENLAVLTELKHRGIRAGILSNGDPPMLEAALRSAGFSDLLDPVLSVHPAARFKTDPAAYALGTEALGLTAQQILFVSSNGWDALGAAWFGYATLWVNRAGLPPEQLDPAPTRTGASLRDVLDFFPAPLPLPETSR